MSIERIDVYMQDITVPFQVWYRPGVQDPVYHESYQNAIDVDVTGRETSILTPLPPFETPIVLPANTNHTFYITAGRNGVDALYYDSGSELGKIYASDGNIDILEGYAMRYAFSSPMYPTRWNGKSYDCNG